MKDKRGVSYIRISFCLVLVFMYANLSIGQQVKVEVGEPPIMPPPANETPKQRKAREKRYAEAGRKEQKRLEKENKHNAEEQKRLTAEQPSVEYDRFEDITKVASRPMFLANNLFGAPQKTLFGSVPSVVFFRMVAVVFYKGQQTTTPQSAALIFGAESSHYWFASDRELTFLVDGNRINLGLAEYTRAAPTVDTTNMLDVGRVRAQALGKPYGGRTNEIMAVEMPFNTFKQIAQGKIVEFRLGSQEYGQFAVDIGALIQLSQILPTVPDQERGYSLPSMEPLGLTLVGYNKIATGMTYEEVVKILGSEGVEGLRSEYPSLQILIYEWKNEQTFGLLRATFQNGKLATKLQVGLR